MEGYNPSVSLLPAGSGTIVAMKGGFMEPPTGYNPSASLLPAAIPGEIINFKGGAVGLNEDTTIPITPNVRTVRNTGSIKGTNFSQQCMLISLWHYVRYCRDQGTATEPEISTAPDSNQPLS